jgi:hypothetical protein
MLSRHSLNDFFCIKAFSAIAGKAFIIYDRWHPPINNESLNSKFFGNSLDLLKYDMLTFLLTQSERLNLLYIPMITEPLTKERNPKYMTYEIGRLNEQLYQLMSVEFQKEYSDISLIKNYFLHRGINLSILNPDGPDANDTQMYFDEHRRKEYFDQALRHYRSLVNKTLVYIDPDVGSDIGITRRYRSNRKLYVRKLELLTIKNCLKVGDFMGYFQHLGNSNYTLDQRTDDLCKCFGDWVLFVGYARIQAGLVFIFNDEATYYDKRRLIENYFRQYDHLKHRDKFIIRGKPPQHGGFSAL